MILETQLDTLKSLSIMVTTPMYGGQCTGAFTDSLAKLFRIAGQYGLKVDFRYLVNESLIPRARNRLAHQFLALSEATHLVFVDADIVFSPLDILTLALEAKAGTDKAVVCGAYPKKGISWAQVEAAAQAGVSQGDPGALARLAGSFAFDIGAGQSAEMHLNRPFEVRYAGTGFMAIRRDVFGTLAPLVADRTYYDPNGRGPGAGDTVTSFFDCDIDPATRTYLSEDYAFCDRVRAAGLKVWVCPWVRLAHIGTHTFEGSLADMMKAGMAIGRPEG